MASTIGDSSPSRRSRPSSRSYIRACAVALSGAPSASCGSSSSARPRSASTNGAYGSESSATSTQPPLSTRASVPATTSRSRRVLPTPASPPMITVRGRRSAAFAMTSWMRETLGFAADEVRA